MRNCFQMINMNLFQSDQILVGFCTYLHVLPGRMENAWGYILGNKNIIFNRSLQRLKPDGRYFGLSSYAKNIIFHFSNILSVKFTNPIIKIQDNPFQILFDKKSSHGR